MRKIKAFGKRELEEATQMTIKSHLCKKCKGVIINSFATSQMAQIHGKFCKYKSVKK